MFKIYQINKEQDIERFIRFPWQVYKRYPTWVPPMIRATKQFLCGKSKFFTHCEHRLFMALENSKIVATAAAFYDRNLIEYYGEQVGLIGYFEALPDSDTIVSRLLRNVEEYLIEKEAYSVWIPFNGNIIYGLGLASDAYDEYPLFLMPYNPPYYHHYFLRNGYKRFKELVAYTIDLVDIKLQRKIAYIKHRASNSPVEIVPIDVKNFKKEIFRFAEIYNKTFKNHWGYVPQSDEELYEMLEPFRIALEKDFVLFAEYKGTTIGFVLCVPNYNYVIKNLNGNVDILRAFNFLRLKKKIRKARLIAVGVSEEYRGQNIAPLLIANAFDAMIRKGYITVEYSWVLAENIASHKAVGKFYGRPYKRYSVYKKVLR